MRIIQSMVLLSGLMALAMLALIWFSGPVLSLMVTAVIGLLLAIVILLPTRLIFPAALVSVLVYGFFLTGWSMFFVSAPPQEELILHHILFSIFVISFWLFFVSVKTAVEENNTLRQKVRELEKYQGELMMLSNSEFNNQAELFLTGMRRRREQGFLVEVMLRDSSYTQEALQEVMSSVLIDSIRSQFDLVTNNGDRSFTMFLQNTDEKGLGIVLERINENCRERVSMIEPPYELHYAEIQNYSLEATREYLQQQRTGA